MAKIDRLVPDIYRLFSGAPSQLSEEQVQEFGTKLSKLISRRMVEERGPTSLRLSNLGTKCDRKLWYEVNRPEKAEPLLPSTRLKFLFGDILEYLLLFLAKVAGHEVKGEQDDLELHGVPGHRDAIIDGVVVDVKSASSFSYAKFKTGLTEGDDSFGYLRQLDGYLHSSPVLASADKPDTTDYGAFLVIDKQHGHVVLDKHKKTDTDYSALVAQKSAMLVSKEPPQRAFRAEADGKSGNEKLGVACSYCAFKHTCWPGVRTFLYSSGPRFLTVVRRTPDVQEITGQVEAED